MDNVQIAEVLPLKLNLEQGFYYKIPLLLKDRAAVGKRVAIPFRNKRKVGIVLDIFCESTLKELKEIEEVLDPIPILSEAVLSLARWIARYYLCSIGTIVSHIVPARVSPKKIVSFLNDVPVFNTILEEKNIGDGKLIKPILFHYYDIKERDLYYFQMIESIIQGGRQVLVLVPDQFSSSELKKKLVKKYGKSLVTFSQKVSSAQKYLRFLTVQSNDIKIVIGTRSSIFLPFRKLGLVIVEREESTLYKEERMPRYHAREVALARGLLESFQVILGSPAPSLESYRWGLGENYLLKTQKQQVLTEQNELLQTIFVDLEKEKSFQRVISYKLQELIAQCLREKKGIVLFLNRRGFAGYIYCGKCGKVLKCPYCNSLMSYRKGGNRGFLICSKCEKKIDENWNCPTCGEKSLKPMGFGTQYVEDIIHRMFPKAAVQCFDSDTAPNIKVQQQILRKYKSGEIDILIGTQLLINRLDFQHTALTGFILIDHLLNIPDYHSAENTFQLVLQVSLKLREQKKAKILLIQTCQPEHHTLLALKEWNYSLFYQNEMALREELEYPPFSRIIKIGFIGADRELVKKEAQEFREFIEQSAISSLVGRGVLLRDDKLFRINEMGDSEVSFLFKIKEQNKKFEEVRKLLHPFILKYQRNKVKLIIDVEPIKLY